MSAKTIPVFQSESDKSNYERKTPLTKLLIDELWRYNDQRLAWCATLDEFFSGPSKRSLIVDGFTPVLSSLQEAEETYLMLARKEFTRLSALRHTSLSESVASERAKSIPVVAVSYKHMKCTVKEKDHMKISRRKFLDIFYRIFQFFQSSNCKSIADPGESLKPTGLVLWLDRMLLASEIQSNAEAWVDRGLAPYMATMSFLSCETHIEADFDHFSSERCELDSSFQTNNGSRVGDVLSSLWIAIEFDLSYGATSVISSKDSLAWTNVMYSLPDIDSMEKGLQTQVRNMLARGRCSISVSGYSFDESMLHKHTEDAKKIRLLDDDLSQPVTALGSPRKLLDEAFEEPFSQLIQDLPLCASLMPLIAGDHAFSRMPYTDDVDAMQDRWSQALDRILIAVDQSQKEHRREILIDLFAPREFDNRCKGLDHMASNESLACLGYLHLLERSPYWKSSFVDTLRSLLRRSKGDDARFVGVLHCRCFCHNLSPRRLSRRCFYITITVFGSVVYPQRAVYECEFWSIDEKEPGSLMATVTGRCSRDVSVLFKQLSNGTLGRNDYALARELSSLLVLHGRIIKFLRDYGCQDHAPELCSDESDWTYAQMLEGCRAFRNSLTVLLLHALNTEVLHTDNCQAKRTCLSLTSP